MKAVTRLAAIIAFVALPAFAQRGAETRVIGYAQDGKTTIEAQAAAGYETGGKLVIGGLDGARDAKPAAGDVVIALANPLKSALVFPPAGVAYNDHMESWVLWRWIETHAPREIVIEGEDPAGLQAALKGRMTLDELTRRRGRSPKETADLLAKVYGHSFNQVAYLQGMALIGQMRLGNTEEVAKLAAPYLGRNLLARPSELTVAGHMVFGELAKRTGDPRYVEMVRKAGDLGFDASGAMKEAIPSHDEMSDSYFMVGPVTAMAGTLTGEKKYYDMVAKHYHFMDKLVLRPDGLYRHSPMTDAAWGRGNAFAALGMALALSEFPIDHPERGYILAAIQRQMKQLAELQDADGMWHEILDEPGSYQETSATSMIATAMLRGIHKGWLDAKEYQPHIDRAWKAVLTRLSDDGSLVDVCESTNKQPSRDAYLHRAALTGKDERGGGMMLLFATEMAGLP